jgi:outer membrane receptor protein involved in Fe transport
VIYDNGKAQVSGFTGELDYKASEDFNLFGRVEFKDYKLASEAQAWNLPKFLLTAGTRIHINDKVTINGSLIYRGTAYDRSTAPVPANVLFPAKITINAFADVSGGVEYKVNHKISIFVQANNLLNTSNQTWLYYPNYGFNIFGGVGFGF